MKIIMICSSQTVTQIRKRIKTFKEMITNEQRR